MKHSDDIRRLELILAALNHIDQGFTVIDSDLRMVGWNARFLELLDFPPELGEIGRPFADFMRHNAERGEYGPGDIDTLVAERVALARKFEAHELERIRPNGDIIAIRGAPIPFGGFVTTYTDITAERRREAELTELVAARTKALRESNERQALMINAVPALIAYIDASRHYTFANRRYAEFFGFTPDSIVGRDVHEVLGGEVLGYIGPRVEQALSGTGVTYEYKRKMGDGRVVHMRSTLLPERDGQNSVIGCFVLSLDITDQVMREAALHQAQKMEAIGQLTGGIAHDFNNLLTIVMGNLLALKRRLGDTEAVSEHVDPALDAVTRGTHLVSRLLTFARGQTMAPIPVDVGAVLVDMSKLLRRSLPSSIEVTTQVRGLPRPAMTDPHQLENALLNLSLNARDAMSGTGTLRIEVYETSLDSEAAHTLQVAAGDYVRIDVEDNGPGMSDDVRSRMFEPFFTTKPFGLGSGLGLSMVYGLVKQSSGAIEVETGLGSGTRISLLLPLADESARPGGVPQLSNDPVPASAEDNPLVLLVEDDDGVRAVVRDQLTDLGYAVIEAASAEEALEFVDAIAEIRLLLSDIVMPGQMNGRVLAEAAKRAAPHIKVALMSGYGDPSGRNADNDSPFPVLAKPFGPEALAEHLARAV